MVASHDLKYCFIFGLLWMTRSCQDAFLKDSFGVTKVFFSDHPLWLLGTLLPGTCDTTYISKLWVDSPALATALYRDP